MNKLEKSIVNALRFKLPDGGRACDIQAEIKTTGHHTKNAIIEAIEGLPGIYVDRWVLSSSKRYWVPVYCLDEPEDAPMPS